MPESIEIPAVVRNDPTDNYRALGNHLEQMGSDLVVQAVLDGQLALEAIADPGMRSLAIQAWQRQQAEIMQEVRDVQQ